MNQYEQDLKELGQEAADMKTLPDTTFGCIVACRRKIEQLKVTSDMRAHYLVLEVRELLRQIHGDIDMHLN